MSERLVGVAIQHDGEVFSLPAPNRHHNVISMMAEKGYGAGDMHDQGFITNTGRFVDRREALVIARTNGQLREKLGVEGLLFSEEIW